MTHITPKLRSLAAGLTLAFGLGGTALAQDGPPHAPPHAGTPNDTFVGYAYAKDMSFPGSPAKVAMNIASVTTTGGFAYGHYAFTFNDNMTDSNDPEINGSEGSQEVYTVGRVEWSGARVLGLNVANSVVRDIGLTTGYDYSSKNDAYSAAARMLILGPTVDFNVPHGFWNVTVGVRTERNHNGLVFAPVHDIRFSPAWHVESAWLVPFNVGPAPIVFKGFASITGPKGKDGFLTQTVTETLVQASWLLDAGALAGHPRTFYVGPGYQYWHNMFGTPASETSGTNRSAAMFVSELHF
jgi:hypothetical protein